MCGINEDSVFVMSRRAKVELSKQLNIDGGVEDAINQLYDDRKIHAGTQHQLFKGFYEPLKQAVEEGFGKTLASVEYGTPNYEMLKNLQTNTAVLAMFKTHSYAKDIRDKLKDDQGNLRSREDFKRQALQVDNTYRKDWLDTEYDTAVRSSRMAAIWAKAQKTKKLYPNLRYVPSRAAHPRKDHQKYYNIIRPLDDIFWATKYPPNGFRCQCGVEPTDEDTTDIPHDLPEPEKGFAFNSGITGQVFDLQNSSYIKSVPPAQQPALIKEAKTVVDNEAAATAPLQPLYTAKNGNTVEAHPIALNNGDFKEVMDMARQLANLKEGPKKTVLLPKVEDTELRKAILPPGVKGIKNPDYLLDDKVADLKTIYSANRKTVQAAISDCHAQCDNLVLKIDETSAITDLDLYRAVKGQLSQDKYNDFGDVYLFKDGKLYKTSRANIVKGEWPIKAKNTNE